MKLIKYIRYEYNENNSKVNYGLFWCSFCEREVEKRLSSGKKAKSCGCVKNELISKNKKGKKASKETKQKMSNIAKERFKVPENNSFYGKHRTEETKQKLSEKAKERYKNPKNNPNWCGGYSPSDYGKNFTKELKQSILKRDNHKCQDPNCNIEYPKKLDVHHIDYNKQNNDPNNLVVLCNSCHSKTSGKNKREYYKKYYNELININVN